MKAIFPGKPQAKLQAVCTALWEGQRIVAYISGNSLIILRGPNDLVQSIAHGPEDDLEAVAICEASGRIATCTNTAVFVYKPYGLNEGGLQWSLQHTLKPNCGDDKLCSLSWGQPREILAGGSHLTLLEADGHPREIWSRKLANPVKLAAFTPDASFLATTGWHDRMVKVWRRSFLGQDAETFDVSYLPHPTTVTSIRWHRRPNQDYHSDTVLYTTCGDLKVRIWAATDHHGLQPLQLWSDLDLNAAIIPRSPSSPGATSRRYAFIMDGWEFENVVEHALLLEGANERQAHTREHLMDVAYRNPDVCVVMDDQGNMSAWGLERVGCKARQANDIFNIAIIEDMRLAWPKPEPPEQDIMCLYDFGGTEDGTINVLAHSFDGNVQWWKAPVDNLFDSAPHHSRFAVAAVWTGHAEALIEFVSGQNSDKLISRAYDNEVVVWTQSPELPTTLIRAATIALDGLLHGCCILPHSDYAVFVHGATMSLWSLSSFECLNITPIEMTEERMSRITLAPTSSFEEDAFVLFAGQEAELWLVDAGVAEGQPFLRLVGSLQGDKVPGHHVLRSAPCHDSAIVAYSASTEGELFSWELDVRRPSLYRSSVLHTRFNKSARVSLGSSGQVAIVDSSDTGLSIWNMHDAHLEFEMRFSAHESISSLEWSTTLEGYGVLAVAFAYKAMIFVQANHSQAEGQPSWLDVNTVELGDATNLPIIACSWLVNNDLLLGAGNQMFVASNVVQLPEQAVQLLSLEKKKAADVPVSDAVRAVNGCIPTFHPSHLLQQLLARDAVGIDYLLNLCFERLKYWSPGEHLASGLGASDDRMVNGVTKHGLTNGYADDGHDSDDGGPSIFTEDVAVSLKETVDKVELPYLSPEAQFQLLHFSSAFGGLEKHRKGFDDAGLISQMLLRLSHNASSDANTSLATWRSIAFASRSTSQELLVDLSTRLYAGKMLWPDARQSGLFTWLSDLPALHTHFETLARNMYTSTDPKDPISCTLHYLALRKKAVLVSLWRLATWNREQRSTMKMLSNNFDDPRWKTAALKNAYALLGLRRFAYAAAFFLLADRLSDAVNVLADDSRVGDIQLAIAVARVYEGDDGPVLKALLIEKVLPQAAKEGNRWMATWAFWTLGEKHHALCALLHPLEHLITGVKRQDLLPSAKSYTNNEPALVHYYAMLREKIRSTPGDRTPLLASKEEHALVMRSVRWYLRAGCHDLALKLAKEWKYSHGLTIPGASIQKAVPVDEASEENAAEQEEAKVEEQAESDEADEGEEDKAEEEVEEEQKPPVPSWAAQRKEVVAEPSAASIFDSFDF